MDSVSLAMLVAAVATVTVVAVMALIGAAGLLYYSQAAPPPDVYGPPSAYSLPPNGRGIDASQFVGLFDEDNLPSLSRVDPMSTNPHLNRINANSSPLDLLHDPAFGSPDWTEEEGATEIFSAHNMGDLAEFAFDEKPRRA